jgi:hypothetical protein
VIHSLEIENFKAFGRRIRIPLAPITLIFGENSAGKSSILHALNLLKQTRESREAGALLLPRTEKGIVDLGSFQDLLYNHDLSRPLIFKIESSVKFVPPNLKIFEVKKTGVELTFSRPSLDEEVKLTKLSIYFGNQPQPLITFQPTDVPRDFFLRRILPLFGREGRIVRSRLRAIKCVDISDDPSHWQSIYNEHNTRRVEILRSLKEMWNSVSEERSFELHAASLEGTDLEEEEERKKLLSLYKDSIQFYSRDFTLSEFIERRRNFAIGTIVGIDGFMPLAQARFGSMTIPEDAAFERKAIGPWDVRDFTNLAARSLEYALDSLFPLGPFRRPPERWYIFTGTSPQDVGYQGDLLPDLLFRRPDLVSNANEWLRRLGIGYSLKVCSVGEQVKDLFEVRLIDNRRDGGIEVSLSDVGFGISQLLPFVVQSLAAEDQIISIEQPEVHIHPKLQAALGDLLAEAIGPSRKNQFIIETHSEHLILRILRRIRESQSSEKQPTLRPEDVCVLYVSNEDGGANVTELPILPEGEFAKDWPKGFFDERAKELF